MDIEETVQLYDHQLTENQEQQNYQLQYSQSEIHRLETIQEENNEPQDNLT